MFLFPSWQTFVFAICLWRVCKFWRATFKICERAMNELWAENLTVRGVFSSFFGGQLSRSEEARRHILPTYRKGIGLKFPNRDARIRFCGNANEPREVGDGPGKSSLFFLTTVQHRNGIGFSFEKDERSFLVWQQIKGGFLFFFG